MPSPAHNRVAGKRGCAHQVLAIDAASHHADRNPRRHGKAALAHRTRLPAPEAGDRSRSLRGSRVAASTTTRHSRLQPTASWSPNGVRFPPQHRSCALSKRISRHRANPSPRVATPLRPERRTPLSISTLRRKIAVALAKRLPRCTCCPRKRETDKPPCLWHSKTSAHSHRTAATLSWRAPRRPNCPRPSGAAPGIHRCVESVL